MKNLLTNSKKSAIIKSQSKERESRTPKNEERKLK